MSIGAGAVVVVTAVVVTTGAVVVAGVVVVVVGVIDTDVDEPASGVLDEVVDDEPADLAAPGVMSSELLVDDVAGVDEVVPALLNTTSAPFAASAASVSLLHAASAHAITRRSPAARKPNR